MNPAPSGERRDLERELHAPAASQSADALVNGRVGVALLGGMATFNDFA